MKASVEDEAAVAEAGECIGRVAAEGCTSSRTASQPCPVRWRSPSWRTPAIVELVIGFFFEPIEGLDPLLPAARRCSSTRTLQGTVPDRADELLRFVR